MLFFFTHLHPRFPPTFLLTMIDRFSPWSLSGTTVDSTMIPKVGMYLKNGLLVYSIMFDTVISSELTWGNLYWDYLYEEPIFCKACFQVGSKGEALVVSMLLLNLLQKKAESRDGPWHLWAFVSKHDEIISAVFMRKIKLPPPYLHKLFYIGFCYLKQIKTYPIGIYTMVKFFSLGILKSIC